MAGNGMDVASVGFVLLAVHLAALCCFDVLSHWFFQWQAMLCLEPKATCWFLWNLLSHSRKSIYPTCWRQMVELCQARGDAYAKLLGADLAMTQLSAMIQLSVPVACPLKG